MKCRIRESYLGPCALFYRLFSPFTVPLKLHLCHPKEMKSIYQVVRIRKHLTPLPVWPSAFPRRHVFQKSSDPLRILFCGSEEFSIASLRALHGEHVRNRDFIASIDVVCKPGKRVGRNLKEIREGEYVFKKAFRWA